MPGVKGRSGGRRPNTGGARPGAGRPTKAERALELKMWDSFWAELGGREAGMAKLGGMLKDEKPAT